MFNGDTLLATADQQTVSGVATGTAQTRYVHPDHLGSTNIVTDENDKVVQTLDYYPYGATRISTNTGTNESRKYIGQFADQSNLDYLNARYMDPGRGQFLSEDPVFLGSPKDQDLSNPQSLNSYSYANDNPIVNKDPNGKCIEDGCIGETVAAIELVDLALEYGPGILGGIGNAVNTYVDYVHDAKSNPNTPAPGPVQYATSFGFGYATGQTAEVSLLRAGIINAAGSLAQSYQNGKPLSLANTAVSFVTPGAGKKLFGTRAGPSALEELHAIIPTASPFFGGDISTLTTRQFGYMMGQGIFATGIDTIQHSVLSNEPKQQTTAVNTGSVGGYGSPGTVYTNYVPANAHTACGTLCR